MSLRFSFRKSLWSRSNGIPPDFFRDGTIEKSKNVPESFALITASISDTRVQNHSDALAGFLLQVAARCVLGNDDALVDQLIANAAECSSSFDILLIVEQLLTSDSSEQKVVPNTDFGRDHFTVSLYTMMLQNFMIVPSVREAVRIDISRFNRCSVVTFAPPLLRLLAGIDGPLDLVDENILLKVLANALNSLLQNDSKHSLEFLIQALNDGVKSTHCSPKKEKLLYSLCSKLGLTWRKSLLSESESFVPNQCFAQVLLCLGEELFRNPSEMTSLLIFGCVAGQPSDYLSYDIRFRVIATKVATELLQLSLDSMTRQRDTSLPASDDIFLRLAPLLLLRRIPSLFFRCAIHDSVISSNFCSLISDVGKELAARLDISDDAYQRSENAFTADERLLSAEIAAFLLPFDDLGEPSLHGTSCYTLIFSIAFEKLANHLNTNECDSKTLLPFIRSGKVALRVVYTALSLAKESDRGSHLVSVATSALQLLSFGPAADIEFCELQDGCVDFLAFCLKRFLHTQMPHTQQEGLQFACLRNETTSVAHSLRKVWDTVKCAIKTGDFTSTLEQSGANFAASSRDQYWRPILLLCQRCNEWELKSFARLNILWIVNFLTSERYRLIQTLNVELSGLLQTVFVILTTTKSFEFFGGSESSRRQNCRKLFLFVVETLNKTGSENCEETYGAVKLAALTVFLSMVIIDVGTSESQQTSFSNDSEVTETLALIKKLAVSDPDERVRQTSNRVFAVINRQCLH